MPLDPSILTPSASVLQSIANPPPIPSYADVQAKQLALQNARLQSQSSQMDIQQKQLELQQHQQVVQVLHDTNGDIQAAGQKLTAMGNPAGYDLLQKQSVWQKTADEHKKAVREDAQYQADAQGRDAQSILDTTDPGAKQALYLAKKQTWEQRGWAQPGQLPPMYSPDLDPQLKAIVDTSQDLKARAETSAAAALTTQRNQETAAKQRTDVINAASTATDDASYQKVLIDAKNRGIPDSVLKEFSGQTWTPALGSQLQQLAVSPDKRLEIPTQQVAATFAKAKLASSPLTQAAAQGPDAFKAALQQQSPDVQNLLTSLGPQPSAAAVFRALLPSDEQYKFDHTKVEEQQAAVRNAIEGEKLGIEKQRYGFDVAGGVSDIAKNIANYTVDPATVRVMLRTNPGLLTQIKAANPDWGEDKMAQIYGAVKTLAPGGTGPKAQTITALNTLMHHSDTGLDVVDALNNGSFTPGNAIYRKFSDTFGQPAGTDFNTVRNMIAGEFAKVAQGGAPHEAEVQAAVDNLKAANSPAQLKAGLNRMLELAGGRMVPLNEEAKSAGLTARQSWDPTSKDFTVLQPSSKEIAVRRGLDPNTLKKAAPASGPAKSYSKTATGPGGHKIGFDGTNWVDVQTGAKVQ